MARNFTPPERVSILPTAWELQRGLLRRTPRLLQYETEGIIQGEGWTLKAEGDWYWAHELYVALGLRDEPRPFYLFFPKGERAWAELPPRKPSSRPLSSPPPPKEERPPENPPAPPEGGRPVKRVRIGKGMDEEVLPSPSLPPRAKEEREPPSFPENRAPSRTARPPDETLHPWLWGLLGGEEFSPYSVDPLLAYRGYQPQAVWEYLKRMGLLRERDGFFALVPPGLKPPPSKPKGKVLLEQRTLEDGEEEGIIRIRRIEVP